MPTKKIAKKQKKTEQRPIVDFGTSVSRFWKRYFDFYGTAQRSEYWFTFLFIWVIYLFLFGLMGEKGWISGFSVELFVLFAIAVFIPRLSIGARRLHDAGFSALWLLSLLLFIPLSVFCMSGILSLVINPSQHGYTASILAVAFGSIMYGLFWGCELPLFIIGLLKPRLKNNKYRK